MIVHPRPLIEVFAAIPDFRMSRGKRHPFTAIFALACCAMLCGARSYSAIAEWGRNYGTRIAQALGFTHATPCAATFHTIFRYVDRDEFETHLGAALSAYGCPEAIVSDHGAVFRAEDYVAMLKALEIEPKYIELRKPWQNLIEAQLKVQLRLADFKFEQASTVEEIQRLHAAFIETFTTTRHGAHQDRTDSRRTPVDVLGWVRGRAVDPERLRRLFGRVQCLRTVNPYGFVSIQRFYIYAEQGLSRQRVAVWIYEGQLRIEYRETLVARYRCAYDQRQKRLR